VLYSVLVRRLSVGEEEGMYGRCWSRLSLLRLGGGGGGGIWLPVLPPETLRFEDMELVRFTPGAGDDGFSESMVLRRDEGGSGIDRAVRTELDRCGSSVLEELALGLLRCANRAPWREGGGGGGDFAPEIGSWLCGIGLVRASTECWEFIVRLELLRDLFPVVVVVVLSWLCRRARGTGGGARFCRAEPSDAVEDSLLRDGGIGGDWSDVVSCVLMWSGCGATLGVGGSGLFMSELSVRLIAGGVDVAAAKLAKDTVCGCL
jgi:hypothetical protein